MLIYLPAITPRIEYVFKLIFNDELGINYQLTNDQNLFDTYDKEKINYSAKRINNEFFIRASSLLFENTIKETNVTVEKKNQTIILFPNDNLCDVGFDIFAAIFYMMSRYEEYLPFTPDKYGRFPATESISFKNNFLQYPIVNIWINLFKEILQKKFPYVVFKKDFFNAVLTYDIDIAYAYKGRSIIRNFGATIKDIIQLRLINIFQRVLTILNVKKDQWDVYDALYETIYKNEFSSIFFFLLGDYSQYDKNLHFKNPLMRKLINRISRFSDIGIHPSFKSSLIPQKIIIEKKRLEELSGKKINKSRQHYLKFSLPETYNHLINSGITEDYSMCFADMPGFRAGTCKPFYFYDLKNEKPTNLKIFPVTFMEGTYIDYTKKQPSEALQNIYDLIEQVKKVNGTFISIWHNSTVSETHVYRQWKSVHDKMIDKILSYNLHQELYNKNEVI